jgi:hypothetical protein
LYPSIASPTECDAAVVGTAGALSGGATVSAKANFSAV